jgi:beta-glucosidase
MACDWWNRAEEDFDRMAGMHQNAHRLSIEWSRIEPRQGVWDEEALYRYRTMLIGLLQRGIEPMVTLHHFTNPLWVAEQGGWENESIVLWFERYSRKVVSALGDLTNLWCTINEPNVMLSQAYGVGRWPPGKKNINAALKATLNLIRAHAASYQAIHEMSPSAQVGIAMHIMSWQPWRPWLPVDVFATNLIAYIFHHLLLGTIAAGVLRVPGRSALRVPEVSKTLDWIGVNYYQRYRIRFNPHSPETLFMAMGTKPGELKGPGLWGEIYPQGMFDTLQMLWNYYRLPMYITENGIPDATDNQRPQFMIAHLHKLWEVIRSGIPVLGYYFWSLVDNFEWTEGYDPQFRFGLFAVDRETQRRTIRKSGVLYSSICQKGSLQRDIVEEYAPELVPEMFTV